MCDTVIMNAGLMTWYHLQNIYMHGVLALQIEHQSQCVSGHVVDPSGFYQGPKIPGSIETGFLSRVVYAEH